MPDPACLDLAVDREAWRKAVEDAERRGCFHGAVRGQPYPPLMERLWAWLVIMASGQG